MAPVKDDDAASTGGSSRGSGSSLGSIMSEQGEEDPESAAADADNADELLQTNKSFIQPCFGVLYKTLSTEKYDYLLRFAASRLVLDFVQLLLLVLRPAYGFEINTDLWVWHAIKWVEFANPLTSDSYQFYLAWMYVGVAIIIFVLALAFWVGWCFKENDFPRIWPIQLLRMIVVAAGFVFYVSCFSVFMAAFNCNWFEGGKAMIELGNGSAEVIDLRFRIHRFPEIKCLEPPHVAHGIIAFIFCGIFTLLAYAVTMTDFDPNPASRRWLATPHPSVEIWALTAKTCMVLNVGIFAGQLYIQSVIMCLATLSLCYLYIRWQPHYNEWVNHFRSGLYTMLFWTSTFIAIMKFDHRRDEPGHLKWLTDIMLIGLGPALCFGALLSLARLRISVHFVLRAVRRAPPGTRTKDICRFSNPQEAEIASRVLRCWLPEDDEVLDDEAVKLADLIIQVGISNFPDDPYMVLAQANFLISIQQNFQAGPSLLRYCSKLDDTTLADQFMIFTQDQELQARARTHDVGLTDIASFVEFQKNIRSLSRAYRTSLLTLQSFWKSLLHDEVRFSKLQEGLATIEAFSKRTDRVFKVMLDKYPANEHVHRLYGHFLEHVKNDPWTGHKFVMEADKLDEENEKTGSLASSGGSDSLALMTGRSMGVVVIDASGTMVIVDKNAQDMFKYKKHEMEGKNVCMLMPQPFQSRHSAYMRNHINTGKKRILDRQQQTLGIDSDRRVFAIDLKVVKVGGVGHDSVFLGAMRPASPPPGVIRVWCLPSGLVLSTNKAFFEAFAKSTKEVEGRHLPGLTRDPDVIMKLLDRAVAAKPSELAEGQVQQSGIYVLHRFLDPVEVEVSVGMGGTDTQRLFCFDLRLTRSQGMLMAVDSRGRLLWMNSDMRRTLGITADQDVTKMDMSCLTPPPYSLLHSRWIREPSATVPKQSCRSGATVVMSGANKMPIPVRPRIMTREADDETVHAVHTEISSWEHGMNERQLELTLDTYGNVTNTSAAPTSLFGFRSDQLIGKNVSSFVDVLAQLQGKVQSVLAMMAEKVESKPGYSWRVGVHPPITKPVEEMSQMQIKVLQYSTRPAIMTMQLIKETDDQIPVIKVHLYRANLLGAVFEVDMHGAITRSSLSPLDPTGYLFGCSSVSMHRRLLHHYLDLQGRGPDCLLQEEKVKGAMKNGSVTGAKVGPLKGIDGFHADGSSLKLNVLAVTLNGKQVVIKCSFNELRKGDVDLFWDTLSEGKQGSKIARAPSAQSWAPTVDEKPVGALSLARASAKGVSRGVSNAAAGGGVDMGPAKQQKGVKFMVDTDSLYPGRSVAGGSTAAGDSSSNSSLLSEEEGLDEPGFEEEQQQQQVDLDDLHPGNEVPSEEDAEEQKYTTEASRILTETDWGRGRRLKLLYSLLTSHQAKATQTRYTHHTYAMLTMLVIFHTAFFATWVALVQGLQLKEQEVNANGNLIFQAANIEVQCSKIRNLHTGAITDARVYSASEEEMKATEQTLKKEINSMESSLTGLYLGFEDLRRMSDHFELRKLWEGDSLEEKLLIDTRQPKVQDESANLWEMGNDFISAAREVLHNHDLIAAEHDNDFSKDPHWSYVIENKATLEDSFLVSLNALLKWSLLIMEDQAEVGVALLIVEVVLCAIAIVWSYYLLKGVSNTRHALMSVFLTIPTGLLRALAERQAQMADNEAGGRGTEDQDEDVPTSGQPQAAALGFIAAAAQPGQTATSAQDAEKMAGKIVVDLPPASKASTGTSSSVWHRVAQRGVSMCASLAATARGGMKFDLNLVVDVGKKRLVKQRKDMFLMLTPLVIWLLLVLALSIASIESQEKVRGSLVNTYMANRLASRTTEVVSNAHELVSFGSVEDVKDCQDNGALRPSLENLMYIYDILLYGKDKGNQSELGFLQLDGLLFDGPEAQGVFFNDMAGCPVQDRPEKYCQKQGDTFYRVTHQGMDSMQQRLFDEVQLLLADDPESILEDGLGGLRMAYIWNIGYKNLVALQDSARHFFENNLERKSKEVLSPMIALFAIMWVALACYCYCLLFPFVKHLAHEHKQVAEMLSHLPAAVQIKSALARAVGLNTLQSDAPAADGSTKKRPSGKQSS